MCYSSTHHSYWLSLGDRDSGCFPFHLFWALLLSPAQGSSITWLLHCAFTFWVMERHLPETRRECNHLGRRRRYSKDRNLKQWSLGYGDFIEEISCSKKEKACTGTGQRRPWALRSKILHSSSADHLSRDDGAKTWVCQGWLMSHNNQDYSIVHNPGHWEDRPGEHWIPLFLFPVWLY